MIEGNLSEIDKYGWHVYATKEQRRFILAPETKILVLLKGEWQAPDIHFTKMFCHLEIDGKKINEKLPAKIFD